MLTILTLALVALTAASTGDAAAATAPVISIGVAPSKLQANLVPGQVYRTVLDVYNKGADRTVLEDAGPPADALTINERPYVWSFAGVVGKSDRATMRRAFRRIAPNFVHETSFWNSPDSLSTAAYRDLLLRTVFVPSPPGTYSLDCFRTYEALEAGCVPIVLRETAVQPFNYYQVLFAAMGFAEPVPFPQVHDWREAAKLVTRLVKDREQMERLRVQCCRWWQRYKAHTRACFTDRVRRAFMLDQAPARWNSAT